MIAALAAAAAAIIMLGLVVFIVLSVIGLPGRAPDTPPLEPLPCREPDIKGMDAPAVVSGSATLESTTNGQDVAIVRARFQFGGGAPDTPLRLRRVERFVSSHGGWVQDAPEVILDAERDIDAWSIGREIPAGETVEVVAPADLVCDAPANVMLFVRPEGDAAVTLPLLAQVPVRTTSETEWFRWGTVPPPRPPDVPTRLFPVHSTVAIALQATVYVVPVVGRTSEWAVVTGQILNLAASAIRVTSLRCRFLDPMDRTLAHRDVPLLFHDTLSDAGAPSIGTAVEPTRARLLGFSVAVERPPDAPTWVAVLLEMCVEADGGASFLVQSTAGIDSDFYRVQMDKAFGAPVPRVAGKVWQCLNGPQASGFNPHSLRLRERFAYDLVLGERSGGSAVQLRRGSRGDRNADYFVYERPFPARAMADGTVLYVQDAELENEGNVPNPGSTEGLVEILHTNGVVARYRHLRPRTAELSAAIPRLNQVVPGRSVRRGDAVGVIGNSGKSDKPHLHVECWKIDTSSGVLLSVPFGFDDIVDVPRLNRRGVLPHGTLFEVDPS